MAYIKKKSKPVEPKVNILFQLTEKDKKKLLKAKKNYEKESGAKCSMGKFVRSIVLNAL